MVKGCRGVIAGLVVICTMSTSMAATAVERHGWLKTQGGYLLNEHGNIVQLRGLSFYWSNPAWSGYSYYNEGTLNALVDQWKCTVVRLAYDRDHGNNNGWDGVQTVLNAAIKKGIYVIIDWHAHDAHNNEGAAVQFFRQQAQQYKNTPNVIFEPYNEPINLSGDREDGTQTTAEATWKGIKGYLKNVTQAIRDEGSKNLVILGTPFFCQFVNVAAGDQIKDKNGNTFENVAYAFHFYSASHGPEAYYVKGGDVGGMEGEYLQGGLGKVPVFVTEWGTTHSDGGEAHDYIDAENTEWWFSKFIDGQYKLSHCNWSVSNFEPSSAFSGGTSPSTSGRIAQKYIQETPDEFEPEWVKGKEGPAGDSVFSMPATHPAASYNWYYGGNISATAVPFLDRDDVDVRTAANKCVKVGPGASVDWVAYDFNSSSATKYIVLRYLAKGGSGSMEIDVEGENVGSISVTASDEWFTKVVEADVGTGKKQVTVKFTGASDNGYLLEWIELTNNPEVVTLTTPHTFSPKKSITISSIKNGFTAYLPPLHGYSGYRLYAADGRVVKRGTINSGTVQLSLRDLVCGMWLVQFEGAAGTKMHRVMVHGQ